MLWFLIEIPLNNNISEEEVKIIANYNEKVSIKPYNSKDLWRGLF